MTDRIAPDFYDVFEPYFREKGDAATLRDFVAKHRDFVAANHKVGEELGRIWSARYREAQRFYAHVNDIALLAGTVEKPNWSPIALRILELQCAEHTEHTDQSRADTASASASASASAFATPSSSMSTAATLSDSFFVEYESTYKSMKETEKWQLPSGLKVEDVIYKYGRTCGHEHSAHSFILDLSEPVWQSMFADQRDREVIFREKAKQMPTIDPELKRYLDSYVGKTSFQSLLEHARSKYFNPIAEFDMHWAQHSMETALLLYAFPGKYFPLSDQSESDVLKHLWIFIDKAFDDTPINIRSGEMESTASSDRRNAGRVLGERKLHGHRVDLLLKLATNELACGEAGRQDGGEFATKERFEKGLKAPKALKDMLCALHKTWPKAKDLEVLAFIIMGAKLVLVKMDRPSSYVCRVTHCNPMYFPSSISTFATDMGSLVSLVYQAKQILMRTVAATRRTDVEEGAVDSSFLTNKPDLPPCPPSPTKHNKRQRTHL